MKYTSKSAFPRIFLLFHSSQRGKSKKSIFFSRVLIGSTFFYDQIKACVILTWAISSNAELSLDAGYKIDKEYKWQAVPRSVKCPLSDVNGASRSPRRISLFNIQLVPRILISENVLMPSPFTFASFFILFLLCHFGLKIF